MSAMSTDCDLCVIGGGEAGFAAAQAGVALGLKVVLVDSASEDPCWRNWDVALAVLRHAGESQRLLADQRGVAFPRFQAELRRALEAAAPDRRLARLSAMNIRIVRGVARFTDPRTIRVGGVKLLSRRFVLATGARPIGTVPHGNMNLRKLLTNRAPSTARVFGGDARSIALAQGLSRLGVATTIETREPLLPAFEQELVDPVLRALRRDGVGLLGSEGVGVVDDEPDPDPSILVHVPACMPRLADLDLGAAGIDTPGEALRLTAALRTTNPRVYAVGGVAGARSTQAAQAQVGVVIRAAFLRLPTRFEPAAVPRCCETDPGLAAVGLSEADARAKAPVNVWRWPFCETAIGAALNADGHLKLIADRSGRIVGAGIVGPYAADQIGFWTMAVRSRMTLAQVASLPLPSPSLAEAWRRAGTLYAVQQLQNPWLKRALSIIGRFG